MLILADVSSQHRHYPDQQMRTPLLTFLLTVQVKVLSESNRTLVFITQMITR